MADLKISQLSAATALAGTEVIPVVQNNSTKKATIEQILTPALNKGINFTANTPAAGMTSQLLNWYEEGTWTPTDVSNAGLSITVTYAKYTRIGRLITAQAYITYPTTSSTLLAKITLPFNATTYDVGTAVATSGPLFCVISIGASNYLSFRNSTASSITNNDLSGAQVLFSLQYQV